MAVDPANPGAGDPWAIRAAAAARRDKAEELRGSMDAVNRAAGDASGAAWTGVAQVAFARQVAETLPDLTLLVGGLAVIADALDTYAGHVQHIQDRQDTLERRRATLTDEHATLARQWDVADTLATRLAIDVADHTQRADAIGSEMSVVSSELAGIQEEWDQLVVQRGQADADCIAALQSRDARGSLSAFASDRWMSPAEALRILTGMSATDLKAVMASHPELVDKLHDARPEDVAEWWAAMSGPDPDEPSSQQNTLISSIPLVIGSLGGIPTLARVAANRLRAETRLKDARDELGRVEQRGWGTTSDVPYADDAAAADYLEHVRSLDAEIDYLQRVADGEVQLYLYDPDHDALIETFGDADAADVIMSFMPGTNTTMESFYTATDSVGVTALTRWEVDNSPRGVDVAGFVLKQGAFPQLSGDILHTGPQNNDLMEALGRSYADFSFELSAIAPLTPVVSVEHSAGSAAGGAAESAGATFAARVPLAGIGMTGDWEPNAGTDYYALQAPNDINKNFDGLQPLNGNWGYAIAPTTSNGFTELDSGIAGTSPWVYAAVPVSPPLALVVEGASQLDHHNQVISGGADNRVVQARLAEILRQAARS